MRRLNDVTRERIFNALSCDNHTIMPKPELHGVFALMINVGRQLIVCIHFSSSRLVMDINGLPVLSDRGCQTCRSENSRAVIGIISLATVRSTPLIHISKKSFYLQGWGGLFLINGGLFNA